MTHEGKAKAVLIVDMVKIKYSYTNLLHYDVVN